MTLETMDPTQEFEAKLLARMKPLNEVTARGTSAVQQFYSGATVFLTGGSGFLGKQLIEKLIRATNIFKIFVLLRSKKGKSMQQRMNEMLQDPLYDFLRQQQPDLAKKLVPVSGDVGELRLGLSEEDWNTITDQVDMVFHLAATTRFDESLRVATLINIRGTREALILGKACKNLRSFVYVSTAYSQACVDRVDKIVSEKFYKSPVNPNTMIEIAESVDEGRINNITPNLINNWPNTYTFAKSIAEELVNTFGNDLPICVVRPAIVGASKLEPTPGWVDMSCIYGASGLFIGIVLGVLHACHADVMCRLDFVPVDYVNNVIIAAGWETSRKQNTGHNKTKIYTVSPSSENDITLGKLSKIMKSSAVQHLSPMMVAYPFVYFTPYPILFWLYSMLMHLTPAYIIDVISVILGKKRRFVRLVTKLNRMLSALSYFLCNQWQFENQNTAALFRLLSQDDQEIFNFDIKYIDWTEYITTWVCIGVRKYLVKDGLTGTIYARKKFTILRVLTWIVLPIYFYCLYKIVCFTLFAFMCVIRNTTYLTRM